MPSSDDVLNVSGTVSFGDKQMAELDPTIAKAMDQSYTERVSGLQNMFNQEAARHNSAMGSLAASAIAIHQGATQLIGAKAATNLEAGLNKDILLARAAAGQPGNAPGGT